MGLLVWRSLEVWDLVLGRCFGLGFDDGDMTIFNVRVMDRSLRLCLVCATFAPLIYSSSQGIDNVTAR